MRIVGDPTMGDRNVILSFGASIAFHLTLISLTSWTLPSKTSLPVAISVKLVDVETDSLITPIAVTSPKPKLKPRDITPPKLLSKPVLLETQPLIPTGTIREEPKEQNDPPPQPPSPPLVSAGSHPGSNAGSKPGETERTAAGTGDFHGKGDIATVGGSGQGVAGSGLGSSAAGSGSGTGPALTGLARPLGGYQVKPRYPEAARRAGAQGTTVLKLKVLANGQVADILIEQSAGHRDLDNAAMEAVKKWRFEPARMGKEPVAVWVLLPIKFELE
jgi:protein TonB